MSVLVAVEANGTRHHFPNAAAFELWIRTATAAVVRIHWMADTDERAIAP